MEFLSAIISLDRVGNLGRESWCVSTSDQRCNANVHVHVNWPPLPQVFFPSRIEVIGPRTIHKLFPCCFFQNVLSSRVFVALVFQLNLGCITKGALFWVYSVDSYSGIRITERTEYHFPKEQTLYYSENRIADVTKMKAMRPRKSG